MFIRKCNLSVHEVYGIVFSGFVNIEFFVARKSKQAFATIILPLMVIGTLAVFGALIPISSGEKYGLVDHVP